MFKHFSVKFINKFLKFKLMKKILAFLVFAIFFLAFNSVIAYPYDTWWNPDWKCAKIINISENSGKDLFDYQILINIEYNESMQPDFDDLRFTYYNSTIDEEIKIPYWIEEKIDGNYSKTWIKVPLIPANSSIMIKIYYSNEYAENESNGSSVFLDFDDFEYIDTVENHGWTILFGNLDSIIETSTNYAKTGIKSLKIYDPFGYYGSYAMAAIKRNVVTIGVAEIWFMDIGIQNGREEQIFRYQNFPYEEEVIVGVSQGDAPGKYIYRFILDEKPQPTNISRTNNWHKFTISWNGTHYNVYIDDIYIASKSAGPPAKLEIGSFWDVETSEFYWDAFRIREFTSPEPTYTIFDLPQLKPPIPSPTDRSLIISNHDWKNIISSVPTRLPVLVADSLTQEVQKFISDYQPDYIYTLGFSLGLNNSYEIQYCDIPGLFFPNATQAVSVQDRDKAILGSNLAYYLRVPLLFEQSPSYETIDLEAMALAEIQELYVEKLKENGDNTNYLVFSNFYSEESAIAGYLAGLRRGFIIPVFNSSAEHAFGKIKDAVDYLGGRKLFSASLDYKKGGPLYLAILGNGSSVNFWEIQDWYSEVFGDKDGDSIYSDIIYGDANNDGKFELATGRLDGTVSETALNLARQRLPKGNRTVLMGEYRHGKFVDALFAFGGMSQAFIIDKMILNNTVETGRIVEKRIDAPRIDEDMDELLNTVAGFAIREMFSLAFGWFWDLPSYTDLSITLLYSLFEFDWDPWLSYPGGFPDHLPVIDENLNGHLQNVDVAGYFGLGDKYWLIPKENRSWTELYFHPYSNSTNFTEIDFSGFLYDDHDISAASEIKRQVQAQGGEVLGSSGMVHDPYTTMSSALFFSGLKAGKSLGEALRDVMNLNPADRSIAAVLYPSNPLTKTNVYLCVKDLVERILFADPAYKPTALKAKIIPAKHTFSVTPSGSFSMSTGFESNYTIENRSITVFNADSYSVEQERPAIPVFIREFVLPTGSALEAVDVDAAYSRSYGLEKTIVYNDSYYTNYTALIAECMQELGLGSEEPGAEDEAKIMECLREKAEPSFAYPYPEEDYWYTSQALLDGRIKVYVYVPAFTYENSRMAKVLEEAEITVEYEAQLEMDVKAEDIPLGEDETIEIMLFNQGDAVSGDLYMWVEGEGEAWNFTESLTLDANSSLLREFTFLPGSKGLYSVMALFASESMTIGPRLSYFEVADIDFSLNKKFWPSEIRFAKKRYWPPVNFPEISIKNTGSLNITSVRISDSLPEGFTLPSHNSFKSVGIESEVFETDDKIPVFVFMLSDDEKPRKLQGWHWPFKKKIKMLKREYYNVSFSGDRLTIETEHFAKTNFGKPLEKNDILFIKYLMSGERIESVGNLTTETTAAAFSGDAYAEKSVQAELLIK